MHCIEVPAVISLLIFALPCSTEAESRSSGTGKWYHAPMQPNIRFTITEKGVQAFMPALPFYLKALLLRCKLKDRYGIQFGRSYAGLSKRNITAVGNDTIIFATLMEPNLVNLNIQRGSVTEEALVQLYSGRSGKSTMEIKQLQGNVAIGLAANKHGTLTAKMAGCDLSIGKIKMTYTSSNGKVTLINPTKIERRVKDSLNEYICDDANSIVSLLDASFQETFKDYPVIQTTSANSKPIPQLFVTRMLHCMQMASTDKAIAEAKKLVYVQRLYQTPSLTYAPQTATFLLTGMFCSRHHCRPGSGHVSFTNNAKAQDKMINLYASDQAVQTFLQSIFDLGLLNMTFAGRKSAKRGKASRQPCSQNISLHDILRSWAAALPDEEYELTVFYKKAPELQYKPGKAVLNNELRATFYSLPRKGRVRRIIVVEVNAQLHLLIAPATGRAFKLKAEMANIETRVLENHLTNGEEEVKQLLTRIKRTILKAFQVLLESGFEVPTNCVTVENLQAEFYQSFLFLGFDFTLNDQCLIKKLTAAVQQ